MVTKVKERGRYVDGLFGLLLTSDRGTGENSRERAKEKREENEKAETRAEPWRNHGLLPKAAGRPGNTMAEALEPSAPSMGDTATDNCHRTSFVGQDQLRLDRYEVHQTETSENKR